MPGQYFRLNLETLTESRQGSAIRGLDGAARFVSKMPMERGTEAQYQDFHRENIQRLGLRFNGQYNQMQHGIVFDREAMVPQRDLINQFLDTVLPTEEARQQFMQHYSSGLMDCGLYSELQDYARTQDGQLSETHSVDVVVGADHQVYVVYRIYNIALQDIDENEELFDGEAYAVAKLSAAGFELVEYVTNNERIARLLMAGDASRLDPVVLTDTQELPEIIALAKQQGIPANKKYVDQLSQKLKAIPVKQDALTVLIAALDAIPQAALADAEQMYLSQLAPAVDLVCEIHALDDAETLCQKMQILSGSIKAIAGFDRQIAALFQQVFDCEFIAKGIEQVLKQNIQDLAAAIVEPQEKRQIAIVLKNLLNTFNFDVLYAQPEQLLKFCHLLLLIQYPDDKQFIRELPTQLRELEKLTGTGVSNPLIGALRQLLLYRKAEIAEFKIRAKTDALVALAAPDSKLISLIAALQAFNLQQFKVMVQQDIDAIANAVSLLHALSQGDNIHNYKDHVVSVWANIGALNTHQPALAECLKQALIENFHQIDLQAKIAAHFDQAKTHVRQKYAAIQLQIDAQQVVVADLAHDLENDTLDVARKNSITSAKARADAELQALRLAQTESSSEENLYNLMHSRLNHNFNQLYANPAHVADMLKCVSSLTDDDALFCQRFDANMKLLKQLKTNENIADLCVSLMVYFSYRYARVAKKDNSTILPVEFIHELPIFISLLDVRLGRGEFDDNLTKFFAFIYEEFQKQPQDDEYIKRQFAHIFSVLSDLLHLRYQRATAGMQHRINQKHNQHYRYFGNKLLNACRTQVNFPQLIADRPHVANQFVSLLENLNAIIDNPLRLDKIHLSDRIAKEFGKLSWGKIIGGSALIIIGLALVTACVFSIVASGGLSSLGLAAVGEFVATTEGLVTAVSTGVASLGIFGGGGTALCIQGSKRKVSDFELSVSDTRQKIDEIQHPDRYPPLVEEDVAADDVASPAAAPRMV